MAFSIIVALTWAQNGPPELGILNRFGESLRGRLRNLPGVEQVVFFGAPKEEVHIDVDAAELAALGLSTANPASRVSAADARRSAGILYGDRGNLTIELAGALDSSAHLSAIPPAADKGGGMVFLGDIAHVSKQWQEPPDQIALHDGQQGLLLAVRTEENIRLDQWAENARKAIAGFEATLDPSIKLELLFDQSRYVETRLTELGGNLLAGAVVVVLVVWVLMGWRPSLIIGSAFPLSAGATLFGLTFFDEQITWVAGASSPPVYYNQLREQDNNPRYSRGIIQITRPGAAHHLVKRLQRELTESFRDAQIIVKTFGQGPPIGAPVSFRVVGPETDQLRQVGERLRALLYEQPEITHTQASILGGEAKLWFKADELQAHLAGLILGDIADQFQAALDGRIGGRLLEDLPVRVRYASADRGTSDEIATLRLRAPGTEEWIPAAALGKLTLKPELAAITRRNGERINTIGGYLHQGALPIEVTQAVLGRLDDNTLDLPPGYQIEIAGDSAEQKQAVSQLLTYAPVLATLMIASLVLSFQSFKLAGMIGAVAVFSVGLGML
ncbi:MAG: efflux RND transporter permease subunit [Gammaproteobacteria bacterium]|nr:efflux RND transporter permease subunit [Gammaproteobacteria bacterium]